MRSELGPDDATNSVYGILRGEFDRMGFEDTDDFIREIRGGDPDAIDLGPDPQPPG